MEEYHKIKKKEWTLFKLQERMMKQWQEMIDTKKKVLQLENQQRSFAFTDSSEYLNALDELIAWTKEAVSEERAALEEERRQVDQLSMQME